MATCKLLDGTILGDGLQPYIVAEVNTSHNGSVETAKCMIDHIKVAGCNCVKFQSWSAETLYSQTYYKENPIAKRVVSKFALSEDELLSVSQHAQGLKLAFCSTPYSIREVEVLLNECNVPFIKIASMDINNYPFLEYIAQTGAPIVLSTGMAYMDEIYNAVNLLKKNGNRNLCLLHCISIYPPELATVNLKNIIGLKEAFPECAIGFSDHSLGVELASAAVAMGATLIEKHFTLDKAKIGMDNHMAIEPPEMAQLVRNCHNVYNALGGKERIVLQAELTQREKMRRSIVATRTLEIGTILQTGDLTAKRPGTGIPPSHTANLIGKKIARTVECDTLLTPEDIENKMPL